MKRALVFFLISAAALPAMAQSSLSTEAQRAYMSGDLQTAKQKFNVVLAEDPHNATALNYLRMIALAEKAGKGGGSQEKQLQVLIVPSVNFKGATLAEALKYLKEQAGSLSGGKVQPNFVVAPGVDGSRPLTLSLTNVPFTEVLRYIGQIYGVSFVIEQYAITVKQVTADRADMDSNMAPAR